MNRRWSLFSDEASARVHPQVDFWPSGRTQAHEDRGLSLTRLFNLSGASTRAPLARTKIYDEDCHLLTPCPPSTQPGQWSIPDLQSQNRGLLRLRSSDLTRRSEYAFGGRLAGDSRYLGDYRIQVLCTRDSSRLIIELFKEVKTKPTRSLHHRRVAPPKLRCLLSIQPRHRQFGRCLGAFGAAGPLIRPVIVSFVTTQGTADMPGASLC